MSFPRLNWHEVTAVFGGTFDPPHLGHRQAVQGLFAYPGVRRVLVIPSGTPPFKPQATSNAHRFEMAKRGFDGLADVEVDRRELDRADKTRLPSYTIDTLLELRREHPQLAFVAGTDQLGQLRSWHRFPELLACSHWIILARKPDGESTAFQTLKEWQASGLIEKQGDEWSIPSGIGGTSTRLRVVPTNAPQMASYEIREEMARNSDPKTLLNSLRQWLTPSVLAYLMEHRIYGMRPYEHER